MIHKDKVKRKIEKLKKRGLWVETVEVKQEKDMKIKLPIIEPIIKQEKEIKQIKIPLQKPLEEMRVEYNYEKQNEFVDITLDLTPKQNEIVDLNLDLTKEQDTSIINEQIVEIKKQSPIIEQKKEIEKLEIPVQKIKKQSPIIEQKIKTKETKNSVQASKKQTTTKQKPKTKRTTTSKK